jgi:uncharacterized RDD family membrane protein YckC
VTGEGQNGPVDPDSASQWWQDAHGNWHEGPRPEGERVNVARTTEAVACPVCGRPFGTGLACQFCGQLEGYQTGVRLSSPGRRLGAYVLDSVLAFFTLGIGWLIWSLFIYGRGQTPGKQLLGMRAVHLRTGGRAGWGRTFLREWIAKGLVFSILVTITFGLGLILYFWLLWDRNNQELWDKVVDTLVVDDPLKQL